MQERYKEKIISATISLLILLGGYKTYYWATDGGTVWTAETARRIKLLNERPSLPNLLVINENHEIKLLNSYTEKLLFVDFIFTRCTTVCLSLGYSFKKMQQFMEDINVDDKVNFLSISFDYEYDTPEMLSSYLNRFTTNQENWSAIKIDDQEALNNLLDSLGVIVIPDKDFGFIHNSAIYVIQNKQIIDIIDYDKYESVIKNIDVYLDQKNI